MDQRLSSLHTLVLNADFRPVSYFPLSTCTWQEAIKALFMGRVTVVSEYETEVHSPSVSIKIPSVVVLRRYVPSNPSRPPMTRHNILLRDKYECQYCGDIFPPRALTLDHVIPRSRGGISSWENLVAACHPCNTFKGDKLPGIHWDRPLNEPVMPTARQLQKHAKIVAAYNFPESWESYLQ
ncbi:HNH endonuclease [bacterium]|nr:HNH endonuclease [bacterium]